MPIAGICNVPDLKNRAIVASTERKLWDTADHENGFDTTCNISQIEVLQNGRAIFAASGEEGFPGSIQIWNHDRKSRQPFMQQVSEVQAHRGPIERMSLDYYNDWLFTAGSDACLIVH